MSDLDDVIAANLAGMAGAPAARRCKVRRILDTVQPDTADLIRAALYSQPGDDNYVTQARLAKSISGSGVHIAQSLLSNHRNGVCICTEPDKDTP